jgi:hypothetical protein
MSTYAAAAEEGGLTALVMALFGTLLSQINKSVSVKVIKSNRVLDLYVERNFRDIHDVDTCIFANY